MVKQKKPNSLSITAYCYLFLTLRHRRVGSSALRHPPFYLPKSTFSLSSLCTRARTVLTHRKCGYAPPPDSNSQAASPQDPSQAPDTLCKHFTHAKPQRWVLHEAANVAAAPYGCERPIHVQRGPSWRAGGSGAGLSPSLLRSTWMERFSPAARIREYRRLLVSPINFYGWRG